MEGNLIVRPDKNEFLLYAMLNALGLVEGNPDVHKLRRKTTDHFLGYLGLGLKKEDYIHHSKPAKYVLTINEAPDFSEKQGIVLNLSMQSEVLKGRAVLSHIKHFYQNTDFEKFYSEILPDYETECRSLQGIVDKANVREVLDNHWEISKPFNMEVIPMPLEDYSSGIGPSIGNVSYQIIGPPFHEDSLGLILHEGSHPRAKRVLARIADTIDKKNYLLQYALKQPNYPGSYRNWSTCFEEHLIRAMQVGFIDASLDPDSNVEDSLRREERGYGMVFINDFYDELKEHKKNPINSLTDVALRILDRLDNKYGSGQNSIQ